MSAGWTGRFAPSPSGPLHFGSLVAALGSYLVAKHQNGQWLVRIEDIDPPRVVTGAADQILHTLEAFGFEWDQSVTYQSQHTEKYLEAIQQLQTQQRLYYCNCSRQAIQQRNAGIYDQHCRNKNLPAKKNNALRIKFSADFTTFHDHIFGQCVFNRSEDIQDFIIRRRDQLFAYQLAVVVDDIEQEINHVVRGADILDSTPRQIFLYHCFNKIAPEYYHLPLVVDPQQQKLSKSKLSPALKQKHVVEYLHQALLHLGQTVPSDSTMLPGEILTWAIQHWQVERVGRVPRVFLDGEKEVPM